MFTALSLAKVRPLLLDKCKAFSLLSQHILLANISSVFLTFSEEWEVSIYGRMIQHPCNILTREWGVVFSWVLLNYSSVYFGPLECH